MPPLSVTDFLWFADMQMQVWLNGERRTVSPAVTLSELVTELGLAGRRVAVEVNQEIIPRAAHAAHRLHEQDRIEIVAAVGGG